MILLYWILLFVPRAEAQLEKVVQEVERVDSMRQSLVSGVQGKVTKETFKAVCTPVGAEIKKVAVEKGWKFRQASNRFRNPLNKATDKEKEVIKTFLEDKNLRSLWIEYDGKNHYFRKITVQEKCLNCHGPKASRPDFIKMKYPEDKAFGFKKGDMRGIYHVVF